MEDEPIAAGLVFDTREDGNKLRNSRMAAAEFFKTASRMTSSFS